MKCEWCGGNKLGICLWSYSSVKPCSDERTARRERKELLKGLLWGLGVVALLAIAGLITWKFT